MSHNSAGAARDRPASLRLAPGLTALAVGIALVAAAAGVTRSARPPPNVGTSHAERLAQAPTPDHHGSVLTVSPGVPGSPQPAPITVAPVSLRITTIHLTAPVAPTGVHVETGLVLVPSDVGTLGWYRFSQGLDTVTGSIVIVGHVDGADQRQGAFFALGEVEVDDRVIVTGADGRDRVFRVIARELFPKRSAPLSRIFARDGAPRLTLVSCGGRFDRKQRSYLDNVVVTAVAVQAGS